MIPHGEVPYTLERALDALSVGDPEARRYTVRAMFHAPMQVAAAVLATALNDEDWRVRKQAVELAVSLEKEAIPTLLAALKGSAEAVAFRNAAVEALIALSRVALSDVIAALPSMDEDGLRLALDVLGRSKRPEAAAPLAEYLRADDLNTRVAACEALGLLGGEDAKQLLLTLLVDTDRLLTLSALEGLNRLEAEVPVHLILANTSDSLLREAAIVAISRTAAPEAADVLLESLGHRSKRIVTTTMLALLRWIERNPSLREPFVRQLRSAPASLEDIAIRFSHNDDPSLQKAGVALCVMLASADHCRCLEVILEGIRSETPRDDIESVLELLGPITVPVVARLLNDVSTRARVLGLVLLSRLAPRHPDLPAAMLAGLQTDDLDLRCAAASSVSQTVSSADLVPDSSIVTALFSAAAHKSSTGILEVLATRTLQAIARKSPETIRTHMGRVDVRADTAAAIAALLGVVGTEADVPWLVSAAASGELRTRLAAIEALGRIGGPTALDAIRFATTDEVAAMSLAAIRALGRMKDVESASLTLLNIAISEGDTAVRCAALSALGPIGSPDLLIDIEPLTTSSIPEIAVSAMLCLAEMNVSNIDIVALSALDHGSLSVARTAVSLLEKCADTSPNLADNLVAHLGHWSAEIRVRLIDLFAKIGEPRMAPTLRVRLADEVDSGVRNAIEQAVATLSSGELP